jgi:uncharacterized protein YndB with AHSA1/START domain
MPQSKFVYVTFIRTSVDRLWTALTSQEAEKKYWFGMHRDTSWQPGAPWKLLFMDGRVADSGEVLEVVPKTRIVVSWRCDWKPELNAEGTARCVFELEPVKDAVKLTVTHSIERPDSKLIEAVSGGWPKILSNLKSLLETGEVVLPP